MAIPCKWIPPSSAKLWKWVHQCDAKWLLMLLGWTNSGGGGHQYLSHCLSHSRKSIWVEIAKFTQGQVQHLHIFMSVQICRCPLHHFVTKSSRSWIQMFENWIWVDTQSSHRDRCRYNMYCTIWLIDFQDIVKGDFLDYFQIGCCNDFQGYFQDDERDDFNDDLQDTFQNDLQSDEDEEWKSWSVSSLLDLFFRIIFRLISGIIPSRARWERRELVSFLPAGSDWIPGSTAIQTLNSSQLPSTFYRTLNYCEYNSPYLIFVTCTTCGAGVKFFSLVSKYQELTCFWCSLV